MDATHEPEEWRPIPGYEVRYEVSDQGRVRSLDRTVYDKNGRPRFLRGSMLKSKPGPDRRIMVSLGDGNHNKRRVHVLVLEAFIGQRPEGMFACHNDGDSTNNRLDNLRWDTPAENMRDKASHGTNHHLNKTHCKYGHEYTPENTYINPSSGGRVCRTCRANRLANLSPEALARERKYKREWMRAWYAEGRGA